MTVGGAQGTKFPPTKVDTRWWLPQQHHWAEDSQCGAIQHRESLLKVGMTHPALFRAFAGPGA